ncbi:conserved protein, unknown function [Hepatocystis sp. ex Piliocolobus tephrosceles]|nr:conserved protein, unknown function [Hepatocystis sp. ex Piliocolobus tephrosceles]
MLLFKNIGLYEKVRITLFRKKSTGPSPLYKTPLKYLWPIFFYIDIFILYFIIFGILFFTILKHECYQVFNIITYTSINIGNLFFHNIDKLKNVCVVLCFFIDFFFWLTINEDVMSEEELIYSTFVTIFVGIIKIITNLCVLYTSVMYYNKLWYLDDKDDVKLCRTSLVHIMLIYYIVINYIALAETSLESVVALFSIFIIKKQSRLYGTIV